MQKLQKLKQHSAHCCNAILDINLYPMKTVKHKRIPENNDDKTKTKRRNYFENLWPKTNQLLH